jgi:hypothetical protein
LEFQFSIKSAQLPVLEYESNSPPEILHFAGI